MRPRRLAAIVAVCGVVLGACKDDAKPGAKKPGAKKPALDAGAREDRKLRVTGIAPGGGAPQGGDLVTITGNRFSKDGTRNTAVFFGGRRADVVRFEGDDKLVVRSPGGTPGEKVDVLVIFEPGGEINLPGAFTYAP